jgi:FKBP-type peptidyl-prolyl cis-trans isomerase
MSFWGKISLLSLFFLSFSCIPKTEKKVDWNKNKSTAFGKEIANEENMSIELFIDQHEKLNFVSTGSGLRYAFIKKGEGIQAGTGMKAEVRFKIELLDGTLCYQSELDKNDYVKIDKEDIESGVQEGLKLMHEGDKCKFIIPSHLAHGLLGDMDKIPPLSVIVVDIELIALK